MKHQLSCTKKNLVIWSGRRDKVFLVKKGALSTVECFGLDSMSLAGVGTWRGGGGGFCVCISSYVFSNKSS